MGFTNAGCIAIAGLLISDGTTNYQYPNAYLGVGDDSTAFSVAHTNLNPASGSYGTDRFLGQVTGPGASPNCATRGSSGTANVLTFVANYTTAQANFAWNENGIFNSGTDGTGTMLTRQVSSLGTKTSASTATFTKTLTIGTTNTT